MAIVRYCIESQPESFRPAGKGRGLPQGMVLSPFLCNLHLHDFDCFLQSKKIPFVRFADDFILFAQEEPAAHKALQLAAKQLINTAWNYTLKKRGLFDLRLNINFGVSVCLMRKRGLNRN